MSETAEEYAQRLMNLLGGRDPLVVLETTANRLEGILQGKVDGSVRESRNGKWSIAEILAHYAEGEIVFAYRLRRIAAETGNSVEAYDQGVWVRNAGYLHQDPALALSLFRVVRQSNVAFLKSLKPEQWENYGIHAERGKESIGDLARLYAGHDLNHLQQIEALARESAATQR